MYDKILNMRFDEAKRMPTTYCNVIEGVVCFMSEDVDGLSKDSQGAVNAMYAIVSGDVMVIMERLDEGDYTEDELSKLVSEFNDTHTDYVASYVHNKTYYDVTVVGSRIVNAAKNV